MQLLCQKEVETVGYITTCTAKLFKTTTKRKENIIRTVCLALQSLFEKDYILFLRQIQSPMLRDSFEDSGYEYPQGSRGIDNRPILSSRVNMTANIIAFLDVEFDMYLVTKNRYTGVVGWFTKSEFKDLVEKEFE